MKLDSLHRHIGHIAIWLSLVLYATTTFGQSSSFIYQGKLTDGGTGANGNYDFQFSLWDSQSGGTQIGSTQGLNVIAVSNGVFSVTLDFGASVFSGANRYLEIDVRPSGAGSFIPLAPRQQLSSTPYAIRTLSATAADGLSSACSACVQDSQINSVSGNKVTGTIPASAVPAGSGNYIQNTSSAQTGNFNIAGSGTASGTLTGNVVNAAAQYNLGGQAVLSVSGVGSFVNSNTFAGIGAGTNNTPDPSGNGSLNSFYGNLAGNSNTTGHHNSFVGHKAGFNNTTGSSNSFVGPFSGFSNTAGSFNSFVGFEAGKLNTTGGGNSFFGDLTGEFNSTGSGNTFVGEAAGYKNTSGSRNVIIGSRTLNGFNGGSFSPDLNETGSGNTLIGFFANVGSSNLTNATAIGANAQVDQSNSLVLGGINGVGIGTADTNVGIGTTAPASRLHVNGTSWFQGDNTPLASSAGRGVAIGTGNNSNNNYGFIFAFDYNANAPRDLLLNYPGGRVGIGTHNPDQTLTVNGNASKTGGGSWATFSDERLKNLKGRFTPGLNAVLQLQPLRYEYKHDNALNLRSEGEHIGFSAQAVQRIIPEAVIASDLGYLEINNDPILWTMLNAIKEQQAEIAALKARMNELQRRAKKKGAVGRQR